MLMALKKNQKGLTLIELLAVLVIVGIIAAIAIPAIGGTITKSKDRADAASVKLIEEATLRYVIDTEQKVANSVTIKTLVDDGYLNSEVNWQGKVKYKSSVNFTPGTANDTWVIELEKVTTP